VLARLPGLGNPIASMSFWRLRPGDVIILLVLALACAWTLARVGGHPELSAPLAFHAALLAGTLILFGWAATGKLPASSVIRIVAAIALIFTLYKSLGQLGLALHPGSWDSFLASADSWLLGFDPSLALQSVLTPRLVDFMSGVYLFFIAYVYLSIGLEVFGREETDRETFLCGLTLVYCLGYVGYLVFPARGPVAFLAGQYRVPLSGGAIYETMRHVIDSQGGAIGAFPSLHVGGALYLCLFDRKVAPLRAMTYAPVVVLVALSTVILRFHYVTDWLGGAAVALFGLWASPRLVQLFASRARVA
jgi:hypothetical protein